MFVDSVEQQRSWFSGAEHEEEGRSSEDDERSSAGGCPSDTKRRDNDGQLKTARLRRRNRKRNVEKKRNLVEALKARERDLQTASDELDLQRAKMSNTVGGTTKDGKRIKVRERKR